MTPPTAKPRVLIATSNTELESRLSQILANMHYSMQRSANGHDALAVLLGPDPPQIALLDAALPGQNSLTIAAEIKRRPGKKHTWITLLSGSADPRTVTAAAEAGVDDVLLCSPGQPVNEFDLRVRLSVASRVQELTRRLESEVQAVSFHALHDNLTGLWNRESLISLLFPETDRVQRMGTPLSFLLLDLDHFTRINAEYGYEVGDSVLHLFADRLRRYMRSYDLIGRCGEDEFLIALPGCTVSDALKLAARIRIVLLRRPFPAGDDTVILSASIGVAQSRGRSPLVVLREAERALMTAKIEGRNCEREFVVLQQPPEQLAPNVLA